MTEFEGPNDLTFNRGLIADPEAFAREPNAASRLYLCGEDYLSAGLATGASADEVIARAEADDAPFAKSDELRAWVERGLAELG